MARSHIGTGISDPLDFMMRHFCKFLLAFVAAGFGLTCALIALIAVVAAKIMGS